MSIGKIRGLLVLAAWLCFATGTTLLYGWPGALLVTGVMLFLAAIALQEDKA